MKEKMEKKIMKSFSRAPKIQGRRREEMEDFDKIFRYCQADRRLKLIHKGGSA